jgi:hypothetical protein
MDGLLHVELQAGSRSLPAEGPKRLQIAARLREDRRAGKGDPLTTGLAATRVAQIYTHRIVPCGNGSLGMPVVTLHKIRIDSRRRDLGRKWGWSCR